MNRRRVLQVFAIAATLVAYLTIVVGGDLTASGAGLACGDSWPFCPGGVIPPDLGNPNVAIEFSHRVIAFTTSLLILGLMILALLWYRRERKILFLSLGSMALLVLQVLLGMATVQSGLAPAVVTAHLALGTATFAATLILAVVSFQPPAPSSPLRASPS